MRPSFSPFQSHVLQFQHEEGNEIVTGKKPAYLIDILDFHFSISFLILSPSFHGAVIQAL